MKTIILNYKNQQLKLAINEADSGRNKKDFAVLAVATLYAGLGVWTIEDIRLEQHSLASPYFNIGAEKYWACYAAPDIDTANIARGLIKEQFPKSDDSDQLEIDYCTFDGIVRGKTPQEMGVASHLNNLSASLHKRSDVDLYFEELISFWDNQLIKEGAPNAREEASKVKINNPWLQLSGLALVDEINSIKYQCK